jgi:hypothetical protein
MTTPHVMNDQEKTLAATFFEALKDHIPGLKPEEVSAEEVSWAVDLPDSNLEAMKLLGIQWKHHPKKETMVYYPNQDSDQGFKLATALQQASMRLTGHWTAFSTNGVEIKADLETTAKRIRNAEILKSAVNIALLMDSI